MLEETCIRGRRARIPWAYGHEAETRSQNFPALRGPDSRKCGAEPRGKRKGDSDRVGAAPPGSAYRMYCLLRRCTQKGSWHLLINSRHTSQGIFAFSNRLAWY